MPQDGTQQRRESRRRKGSMKALKIAQLVGILMLLVGVIIRAGAGEFYGMHLALLGLLIYTVAKVTAWIKTD